MGTRGSQVASMVGSWQAKTGEGRAQLTLNELSRTWVKWVGAAFQQRERWSPRCSQAIF